MAPGRGPRRRLIRSSCPRCRRRRSRASRRWSRRASARWSSTCWPTPRPTTWPTSSLARGRAPTTGRPSTASSRWASSRAAIRCRRIRRRPPRYGTGGLNELRFEANAEKHTRGAVSAVLVPGRRDSGGSQFFISVSDQPALDGQYTVFARVADGMTVAQKISTVAADGRCRRSASRSGASRSATRRRRCPSRSSSATVAEMAHEARGARDVTRPHHDRGVSRSRAEPRAAVPAARRGGRLRRDGVPPCREGLRDPGRASCRHAASRLTIGRSPTSARCSRSSTPRRTIAASCRWRAATTRPAPRARSSSCWRGPRPSTTATRCSAVSVAGLDVVEKIEAQPVEGETPVTRIEVSRARVE